MIGIVTYVVANYCIDLLILTTSTSDNIITALVPIAIAVAIVLAALGRGKRDNEAD